MDPVAYLDHAARCRAAAERSTDPIRGDFLAAAAIWEMLAAQMEWLLRSAGDPTKVEALEAPSPASLRRLDLPQGACRPQG